MKILAIGAHFDDLELSCGGTLAKFIQKGHEVFVNIVTTSDYAYYNGEPQRGREEAEEEGMAGLAVLGIKKYKITNLGFKTKEVPFDKTLIEPINRSIDIIKPDLILTHSLSSSHQDHINTSKSVMAASRYQKNIWTFEPMYPDKITNNPFKPIIYVNISDTFDKKIESLKAHASQFKKYPEWIPLITAVATLRGIENKCRSAEAFEPIKMEFVV